jgi:hypothetical protein
VQSITQKAHVFPQSGCLGVVDVHFSPVPRQLISYHRPLFADCATGLVCQHNTEDQAGPRFQSSTRFYLPTLIKIKLMCQQHPGWQLIGERKKCRGVWMLRPFATLYKITIT